MRLRGVLLAVGLLGVAACGGGDDGAERSSPEVLARADATVATSTAPPATEPPTTTTPAAVVETTAAPPVTEAPTTTAAPSVPQETASQRNARKQAESYLRFSSFSQSGLAKQLEYEGFSVEDAAYAVGVISVDWNEQAAKKAASYLEHSAFSRSGLITQLEYEGFTPEQAEYGVSTTGL